jgi:hypothetical protein
MLCRESTALTLDKSERMRAGSCVRDWLAVFAPVKGFDILIRAFALLAPHHRTLLLVLAVMFLVTSLTGVNS